MKAQYFRERRHQELAIEADQAAPLHDACLTICVSAIEQHLPAIAEFTTRLRNELRFAGEVTVNCCWSPAGGGFGTHFDDHHVFILQVAASKRLALTLSLAGLRLGPMVSDVAGRWFERSVLWRETLPVDAAPGVGLTPAWRDHLAARLAEFREFAATLTPEMLAEEWLAATVDPKVDAAPADGILQVAGEGTP